jgi:hypothetical protein
VGGPERWMLGSSEDRETQLMAITFAPVHTTQGFDAGTNPGAGLILAWKMSAAFSFGLPGSDPRAWQMVPLNGFRELRLRGVPPGKRITVASDDETRVKATYRGGLLRLEGVSVGTASIAVRVDGLFDNELAVTVKARKKETVAFNFLSDQDPATGKIVHRTRRDRTAPKVLIGSLNGVYMDQANIEFSLKSTNEVTAPRNLSDEVTYYSKHANGMTDWNLVTSLGDGSATYNVFFVWELEDGDDPAPDALDAGTVPNVGNTLFEDNAGLNIGWSLAHEAGHYLGCPDRYDAASTQYLMYGYTDQRGNLLNRSEIDTMNP